MTTTLLKIDSADKIRVIFLSTDGGDIVRATGILYGNLINTRTPCTGKNIGKANETKPDEQAILEMNSTIVEKCSEGYVNATSWVLDTINEAEMRERIKAQTTDAPQAMLAKVYEEKYADFKNGVLCSPKLDGMRCMAVVPESGPIILWSRGGKQIDTMGHIIKDLEIMRTNGFYGTLDGELYYHDKGAENFQDIMKAIKKYRPGISENVQYWVYDIISTSGTAENRALAYGIAISGCNLNCIHVVPQFLVHSKKMADEYHEEFLSEGYEGTMLKNASSLYQPDKRSSDLLKLKDFQDAEYEIADIVPMERMPECGKVICRRTYGDGTWKVFTATPKMSYADRKELLDNKEKYIGRKATIQYFSLTDDGLPRFPIMKGVRIDV
jgi:ATP-dependent DNA ligase